MDEITCDKVMQYQVKLLGISIKRSIEAGRIAMKSFKHFREFLLDFRVYEFFSAGKKQAKSVQPICEAENTKSGKCYNELNFKQFSSKYDLIAPQG